MNALKGKCMSHEHEENKKWVCEREHAGQASLRRWHFRGSWGWSRSQPGEEGRKGILGKGNSVWMLWGSWHSQEGLRGPEANSWVRQGHTEDLDFRKWPQNRLVGIYMKTYTPVFPSYLLKSAHMKSSFTCLLSFPVWKYWIIQNQMSFIITQCAPLWQKRKHALIERLLTQRLESGLGLEFGLGLGLRLGLVLDV